MKTKLFLTVMFSLALTLGLVITGCENGTTDEETNIAWGAITAPNVTVQPVEGGIILSWKPIIGASSYEVYRTDNAGVEVLTGEQSNYDVDPKTGKLYYGDLISDNNPLAVGTARTYTVYAISSSPTLGNSQTTVSAAPTSVPTKGTKLANPTNVTLTLDADHERANVTWTAGSDNLAISYAVRLYQGNSFIDDRNNIHDTSAAIDWDNYYQSEGTYTARVIAYWNDGYYTNSDTVVSDEVTYELLFANSSHASIYYFPITAAGSITGYIAQINLNGISKPGVAYTVERAAADALGNTSGAYAPVTLSKDPNSAVTVSAADLIADLFGNIPVSSVYDRTLPASAGYYRYRVKATKGTAS